MFSFVITLAELFKMDTEMAGTNFNQSKKVLVIPAYQREYKWEDERIESLLSDIQKSSKFIGNIIVDETISQYEIIDGQQRITTCFLTLAALFNRFNGHPMEQCSLKEYIAPNDQPIFLNKSVGNYLKQENGVFSLSFALEDDIYRQKSDFERAFAKVSSFIDSLGDNDQVDDFKRKLLDSELLVLVNDQHDRSHPVEQIFLDINEKAQHLKTEDIFKGHCFKRFDKSLHEELKGKWVRLKRNADLFKRYGFDDASEYIYSYLLETDNARLPQNLTKAGKHYLDNKTMDDINALLNSMIQYGDNVNSFYESINQLDYRFEDICEDSKKYRTTDDHAVLKGMCLGIMNLKNAVYQKLPFFQFVSSLLSKAELRSAIKHDELKRIVTNMYMYTGLFALSGDRKSKADIDQSLYNAISTAEPVKNISKAAKSLRNAYLEKFAIKESYSDDKMFFLASVIDFYSPNKNWLSSLYSMEPNYSIEHLILPQNKKRNITWINGDEHFDIPIDEELIKANIKKLVNQLVLDRNLNGSFGHEDIVSKIEKIKQWFMVPGRCIPRHIEHVIGIIEEMPEYVALLSAKASKEGHDTVTTKYLCFLNKYFSPEFAEQTKAGIMNLFITSFQQTSSS